MTNEVSQLIYRRFKLSSLAHILFIIRSLLHGYEVVQILCGMFSVPAESHFLSCVIQAQSDRTPFKV